MPATGGARNRYEAALGIAWLAHSSCRSLVGLLKHWQPEVIWRSSRRQLLLWGIDPRRADAFIVERRGFDAAAAKTRLVASGLRFLPFGDGLYPIELAQLDDPPAGLFVRGDESALHRLVATPRVTVVGTRRATAYGLRAAEGFASAFAGRGIVVVSGMALGVDGRVHRATVEAGGLTAAVLGCGADVVYPRRHRCLYDAVVREGVVLSELPPGAAPARWTFPHRNRLLAAIGDAVLVVEASQTSGALQTVDWALTLGKPVFGVPGPIHADGHRGCNMLLYDGACPAVDPCVTVEDFLWQTRMQRLRRRAEPRPAQSPRGGDSPGRSLDGHDGCHRQILKVLASGPSSVDRLVAVTGLSVRGVGVALAGLELAGQVKRAGPGLYIRAP